MKVDEVVNISCNELSRLRDCERAWFAVFDALIRGNPEAFKHPDRVGQDCALAEIARLQILARAVDAMGPGVSIEVDGAGVPLS